MYVLRSEAEPLPVDTPRVRPGSPMAPPHDNARGGYEAVARRDASGPCASTRPPSMPTRVAAASASCPSLRTPHPRRAWDRAYDVDSASSHVVVSP